MLPASAQSFHDAERYIAGQFALLKEDNASLRRQLDDMSAQMLRLQESLDREENARDLDRERQLIMYWQLMRREGESLEDTQIRFFRALPKASGIHQLFQDAEAKLFALLSDLCKDHEIQYWGTGGTVLGAFRHGDFIPWDDDVDIYIPRDQLDRLAELVEADDRFRITVLWDWYVPCKQIRFRLADDDNPCFIDLFPLDWVASDPKTAWEQCSAERRAFVDELREAYAHSEWSEEKYIVQGNPCVAGLEERLASRLASLGERLSVLPTSQGATGLIRGIENIDEVRSSGPYPIGEWMPPEKLTFRGVDVPVPRDYREYLRRAYGDYMSLPADMHTHEHVAADYIGSPASIDAMNRFMAL
ncbi:LicD family protein [Bifidobacterium actinocoloniiforme]|uniref:LicD family protein n=1 Tax=Bifidobacterium actinocoloniiforme TaxID=638619 RepID=UPI00130E1BAB|nr:LicD family protein [Bifidobacterium actinocoloniiforme]